VDQVVNYLISHTNGLMYKHLVGNLRPIQFQKSTFRMAKESCFWILVAAGDDGASLQHAKGYSAVGIDPSLGAILAARRVAKQFGMEVRSLLAMQEFLPFKTNAFDVVYSYSVIQHFSLYDARLALKEAGRVLRTADFTESNWRTYMAFDLLITSFVAVFVNLRSLKCAIGVQ